jgi:alpha-galactosidase
MSLRIAVIGAGSIEFTRKLVQDVLMVPEFGDTVFAFTDISERNLDMVQRLAERDIKANRLAAHIEPTMDRRRALEGADYVINTTRIGGLRAFALDVDIPLKYGVDQCVGDTICAGGIMYGQRNIPVILEFCRDIREVAAAGALFLNYANPNAMNTWAAEKYGKVRTIGLCHGVQHGHRQLADVIELLVNDGKAPDSPGYVKVTRREVDIICAGVNHQTWYVQVRYRGEDWTGRLLEGFERHPVYAQQEKVRIDVLRRFGYYSTESNGHLSEYLPWYRKRPDEIGNWISLTSWVHGETGGYLRYCTEGRNWFETDFPQWMKEEVPRFVPENRSEEHASYMIEALELGRPYRGHFNVVNGGCITNLPPDCVVETPCYVDRNGISVPRVGDLPLGCVAICNVTVSVQRLAVEAAVHGDVALLKQAMLMDPLVGAVCTSPEISQMTDEMLVAQSGWLPQYQGEIRAAQKRLASEKPLGGHGTAGAARLPVKTPEQLREGQRQGTQT